MCKIDAHTAIYSLLDHIISAVCDEVISPSSKFLRLEAVLLAGVCLFGHNVIQQRNGSQRVLILNQIRKHSNHTTLKSDKKSIIKVCNSQILQILNIVSRWSILQNMLLNCKSLEYERKHESLFSEMVTS